MNDMVLKTIVPAVGMIIVDVAWLTMGVMWLVKYYMTVQIGEAREIMLGKKAPNINKPEQKNNITNADVT